jgi:hypothetical protein
MNAQRLFVAAALAAAVIPVSALAATQDQFPPKTMSDLVALCTVEPSDPLASAALNFCHGFAQGAISVEMTHAAASRRHHYLFCLPTPRPTFNESQAKLTAWAQAHPAAMDEKPADGLFRFLGDTYPCTARK